MRKTLEQRFWAKVDTAGECWLWTASTNDDGYGIIGRNKKVVTAHRVVWELTHGSLKAGEQVLHRCDTPACVRVEHLFLGTASDNMRDMWNKGRHPNPRVGPHPSVQGSKHPHAKLTEEQVAQIRRRTDISRIVAAEFGISAGLVRRLRNGIGWQHVRNDDSEHLDLVVRAEVVPGQKATRIELQALP